jgi:hypothetical protein
LAVLIRRHSLPSTFSSINYSALSSAYKCLDLKAQKLKQDYVKLDHRETEFKGVDWVHPAQNEVQYLAHPLRKLLE